MRGFALAVSIGFLLTGVSALAQAPAQPAPKPTGQAPAAPAPGTAKPAPTTPAPAATQPSPPPAPPAPFPQGAKVGYVYLQQIAALSAEGKAAQGRVSAFTQKKQTELADKQKALQASQQKLQTGGSVMSETARAQLEKDIDRQQRDLERLQQDAQSDINEMTQEVQTEFNKKLFPILEQVSKEKGIHMLFSATDAGLIWAEPALDLTMEAVKKLDAAATPAKPQ